MRPRAAAAFVAVAVSIGAADGAAAHPGDPPDAGALEALDTLDAAVAADLAAGRPLVVQVHVALCDNQIIDCGGRGLGDGDDLARNLYWATSGGLRGWFERRGSGWTRVARAGRHGDVLETVVYRRRVAPGPAWRRRGVRAPFDLYVVAEAWRGRAIEGALDAFVADLYGGDARVVALDGGGAVAAGGAARLVAYVGHNGWMDRARLRWPSGGSARAKGFVAIACLTRDYLARAIGGPTRVPLVLTRDLVFAGSHALDGAVQAFAGGGSFDDIRQAAARAYADGERKAVGRVETVFTNPGDRKWTR